MLSTLPTPLRERRRGDALVGRVGRRRLALAEGAGRGPDGQPRLGAPHPRRQRGRRRGAPGRELPAAECQARWARALADGYGARLRAAYQRTRAWRPEQVAL